MKFLITTVLFFMANVALQAQNKAIIEEVIIDTMPAKLKRTNEQKTVTIRLKGDKAKDEKIIVEIDGGKIKINGKDAIDFKDIDVTIGENRIMFNNSGRTFEVNGFPKARIMELDVRRKALGERKMSIEKRLDAINSEKALLGIGMEKVDKGVKITNVTENSGAEKAGLKEGDIITKIEDKEIKAEMDITNIVNDNKPGKEITINYIRDGKKQNTKATLGKRNTDAFAWSENWAESPNAKAYGRAMPAMPAMPFEMPEMPEIAEMPEMQNFEFKMDGNMPGMKIFGNGNMDGATLYNLANGPKLGVSLTETESGNGLEVTNVEENSAAAKAGLQKGDIVTKVADKEVKNVQDIRKLVQENKEKPFAIIYLRKGKEQKTEIKFSKKLREVSL